ncbi:hypothetical protein BV898_16223 [Hypsibius exemplaris]|uniref:Uncharacterized protein n=1 Tax=Hypsibius exemplaris TaxID=2072580 RepID=A0A9X6RKY3_HYPEX|nr:hypothetical protein BV898_16223 [Hypsibius exemplaris]
MWNRPIVELTIQSVITTAGDTGRARLLAVISEFAGVRLNALPVSSLGNLLDDHHRRTPSGCHCMQATHLLSLRKRSEGGRPPRFVLCVRHQPWQPQFRHQRSSQADSCQRRRASHTGTPGTVQG